MQTSHLRLAAIVACLYLCASGCSGTDDLDASVDIDASADQRTDAGPALDAPPRDNLAHDGADIVGLEVRGDTSLTGYIPPPDGDDCTTGGHDEAVCAQTCILSGNIRVQDQADLHRMAKLGCDVIDGSLFIEDTRLTDLDGLDSIRVVTNWLHIEGNDRLADIDGLRNIERFDTLNVWDNARLPSLDAFDNLAARPGFIGPDIRIRNNPSLESIDGFAPMESALFLWIEDNPSLADLSGLQSLERAGWIKIENADEIVDLGGLERLEHVGNRCDSINGGGFSVRDNDKLRSLDGLDNLQTVPHGLGVNGNPSLVDISALSGLEEAGPCHAGAGLVIGDNDALESLDGRLSVSSIALVGNDALADLDALSSMTDATYVEVSDNDSLQNLDGLQNLRSARYLDLLDNDALTDVTALHNLSSVGHRYSYLGTIYKGGLHIKGNEQLADLDGLSALGSDDEHRGDVSIEDNPALVALGDLTSLTRANDLVVKGNGALASLAGLHHLRHLDGGLTLEQNAALQDADALLGLESLEHLRVVDNPQLPSCYAHAIATSVAPEGTITIQGNTDGVCP